MTALVTADGRRATPGGWMYQLSMVGIFVPADTMPELDKATDEYVFEARRMLFVSPQPNGMAGLARADKAGPGPTVFRVPRGAVVFRHDVTNDEFLRSCATELSGLAMAPGARVN